MDVSIVIPVYNALPLARQCLESIFTHGSELTFEVIVVDNGSAADVKTWLLREESTHPNLRHLRYAEPLGFARAVNLGAAEASGEVLIVLNSDTIVTSGWMDDLYAALRADPSLGALTPTTNHAGEPAQMDYGTIDLSPAKAFANFAKRLKPPNILHLPQRLTFFCVALRQEVWRSFNGLDETYAVGNFEDDDLCLRLRVAGFRLGVSQHVFVYHHNNGTFEANLIGHNTWLTKNAAIFAERARLYAEANDDSAPQWPKRSGRDISVVVLPAEGGSAERTLRSLANQTVVDFEVILPNAGTTSTRPWIAYVAEGDVLYPFHLEALLDALSRTGSEAIYADGWIAGSTEPTPHPDACRRTRNAPLLLAGWMHHASLDPELLWEESSPTHWPRLTWEMQHAPIFPDDGLPPRVRGWGIVGAGRFIYRLLLPYETRIGIDRGIRKAISRMSQSPEQLSDPALTRYLETLAASNADKDRAAVETTLPPVVMFNAVAWNSAVQRQHHFARGLAEQGHTVYWIDPELSPRRIWWTNRPLQQVAPGVHVVRLPGSSRNVYRMDWDDATVDEMTAALVQTASVYGIRDAVALVNYPQWQPLAARLRKRLGWKILTDCLDDQRALAALYSTVLGHYEERLLEDSDRLITSSVILQKRLQPHASLLLHNGNDYDLFSLDYSAGHLRHLPRPIIGFFGVLADWIDMELVHAAAKRFPEWTFVYIGPYTFSRQAVELKWLRCTNVPNIVVLPHMAPRRLAAHLSEFDVCTMPFLDIPVTRSMNPVKLYEYLAAGKPTVSRDLPEVRHLMATGADDLIALYTRPEEFFQRLIEAVAGDTRELRERRQRFARHNDWKHRVEVLSQAIRSLVTR